MADRSTAVSYGYDECMAVFGTLEEKGFEMSSPVDRYVT